MSHQKVAASAGQLPVLLKLFSRELSRGWQKSHQALLSVVKYFDKN